MHHKMFTGLLEKIVRGCTVRCAMLRFIDEDSAWLTPHGVFPSAERWCVLSNILNRVVR